MYQIFARKYRPQSFDEVLGQEAIVQTLKNVISYKRVHQAYLFCGARGVGKTSLARIFAKSLNCEKGPTDKPCQTCPACKSITQGNSLDVLEIDGASNTGVDDVRELREQVKYLPTAGQYKIYIIDEVHMLSQSAFNALLKTLEEPPAHVIFIFATTEPHKIPVTILSRCQRFDFKRLSVPQLTSHLQAVLTKEEIKMDEESLTLITSSAEGSVRDSLSLLDQIVSFCGPEAKAEKVRELLGLADRVLLFEMVEGVLKSNVKETLKLAQTVHEKGFDLKIFSEGLLEMIRHLLIIAEGGDEFVELSPGEKEKLKKLALLAESSKYLTLFQILARGTEELARSDFPKMIFETTLLKMMRAQELMSIPEILDRLNNSESSSVGTGFLVHRSSESEEGKLAPTGNHPAVKPSTSETDHEQKKIPTASKPPKSSANWGSFVKKVLEIRPQVGAILEHAQPLNVGHGEIALGFEPKSLYAEMLKERITTLQELAQSFFKRQVKFDIQFLDGKGAPSFREIREKEAQEKAQKMRAKALSSPEVRKAQEILGAKVKEVKEIK